MAASVLMRLFDTATKAYVDWQPPEQVRIYVCGITPYDSAHLGHILTFMTYDLLQRYLEDQGHEVTMVRNITDVDEPIYQKAAELGIPYTQLAERETKSFHEVLSRLRFKTPSYEPRASQYIPQMADAVSRLLASGHAYYIGRDTQADSGRDIYFDTEKLPANARFGSFSGFNDRLQRGLFRSRGGDPDRPGKRQPMDFLLWKAIADPHDPAAWDVGHSLPHGRPGWHIECSVMSSELLSGSGGLPFDIHGGGNDLIFPHHECEVAQTRALSGTALARHWLHVAPLHYCGEKMSKSLGNLVFARDLLEKYEPSVIRLALMNYHHRIGGEWNPCLLQEAAGLLSDIRAVTMDNRVSLAAAERLAVDVRSALACDLDTHAIRHSLELITAPQADTAYHRSIVSDTSNDQQAVRESLSRTLELLGLSLEPEPIEPLPAENT